MEWMALIDKGLCFGDVSRESENGEWSPGAGGDTINKVHVV